MNFFKIPTYSPSCIGMIVPKMKILLFIFLSVSSVLSLNAQNSWNETFTALQQAEKESNIEVAESLLEKALDQAENTYGKKHQAYVLTLHLGVKLSFKTQDYEKGLVLAKEEMELMKDLNFDQQTQFYIQLLNFTSQLNLQLGNIEEAMIFSKDYMEVLNKEDRNSLNHALAVYDYASLRYQNQEDDALEYF